MSKYVERGDGWLRSDMTAMKRRFDCPVPGCYDANELGELVHVFESAPRGKHVVGQIIHVVPNVVV